MKHYLGIFTLILILGLTGCQYDFSKGVKKDFGTGITVNNDGLSYGDYYLSVNDVKLDNSEVNYGDKVYLVFSGVEGFSEVEGKVFPGAAMQVTDRDGKIVLQEKDLFAAYDQEGVDPVSASDLSVSLLVGDPMIAGESYDWKVKFWDKKSPGEINAELQVKVK